MIQALTNDTHFAAMTAPTSPQAGIPAGATKNSSRAKRSWPARLDKGAQWRVALAYAHGVKLEAIAAEFAVTTSYVSHIARNFGLTPRGRKPQPPNPADVEHLRRWARRKAQAARREAFGWEALAELE